MTFDEVMKFTLGISSSTAFEDEECKAYYDFLNILPAGSDILEIGLQFGRSSSIALQVAREKGLNYVGVDPFIDPPEAAEAWLRMAMATGADFTMVKATSSAYGNNPTITAFPDLVLVDGDHTAAGVLADLNTWARWVMPGGYMLFHDYGRDSLPDVYPMVNAYFADKSAQWDYLGVYGTLGVWRKRD